MSWIEMISEKEASGKLKRIYQKLIGSEGEKVANILKVHSLNPAVLEAHLGLYRQIMYGQSPLTRVQREMIAVVVSAANQCHY